MSKDMVKRPDHYCFSKFEPKDVIREWGLTLIWAQRLST